ncbi:MAG: tetratricopeptide repeat protein [Bdellovibrionota bacterium]
MEKVAEQWKILGAVLGVVLVAVAAIGISNEVHSRHELAGTNALYDAQTAAHKAVAEKKFDQAEQIYSAMIDQHSGTRAAFEAELQLGDIWMDAGNYDKAVTYYQKAAAESADPFSKLLATYTIGIAKESAGKFDEAVKSYEDALAINGSDFLRPEVLMAQARCLEALNQGKKAIEIYKTVEDKYASRAYYSGAASAFEKQLSAKNL